MPLALQAAWLFLLSIPVACVAWTVTHEEVLRESREYCKRKSQTCRSIVQRKFFYLFTCEYCFSHYVAAFFVGITGFNLLLGGWRGYLLSWFAVVWVANVYMSIFDRLRLDIKEERLEIKQTEQELKAAEDKRAA